MIALDTYVIMDLLSGEVELVKKAKKYLNEVREKGGIASAVLLTEIVYHVSRRRNPQFAEEAVAFIRNFPNLSVMEVTVDIAVMAGRLRNKYYKSKTREISFLDCVHLASALSASAQKFVTGDKDFDAVEEMAVEIYR
ncbi:MAG: PIN domain-containing protein [Candidatus Aenigmarchaeota archaeon]|nr:PIN domain-containing protein [Candidatus Aenigmarchaeota archaeon]